MELVILVATALSLVAPPVALSARLRGGPVLGPLATKLDSMVPGARGVFLADVTRISEHEATPVDGDRYQRVELTSIRATGVTKAKLYLVRESGGFRPPVWYVDTTARQPAPRPPARFRVNPDEFSAGRRYWFATASLSDPRYPQGIAGYWPVESTAVASLFEQVVLQDAYRWHPAQWPEGYVTGWFDDSLASVSRVRVWREKRPLWEKRLPGALTHWLFEALSVSQTVALGNDLCPPGLFDGSSVLLTEVRSKLDSVNVYGVRPGSWRLQQLHDMQSGRLVATRVRVDQLPDVERVYQAYDSHGRLIYERIQDSVPTGGSSVGADRESWLRRVERWLDARTGRETRLAVKRHASLASGSDWLPVDVAKGLAAGPLRGSK